MDDVGADTLAEPVASFLDGKFERLRESLDPQTTFSQLSELEEDEFVSKFRRTNTIVAMIFWRQVVEPRRRLWEKRRRLEALGGLLDLGGGFLMRSGETLETVQVPAGTTEICLDGNSLGDGALPTIREKVVAHVEASGKRLCRLDISCNKIDGLMDGALDALTSLLDHAEYVNITKNPITLDQPVFLAGLSKERFGRLIWVPEAFLVGGIWHNIVLGNDRRALVQSTHREYYNTFSW